MTRRVLLLTKYTRLGASSRYRAYQYLPYLEREGFACEARPLLPDCYLGALYGNGRSRGGRLAGAVACLARRWLVIVREAARFDAVYLEYEALPYVPLSFEQALYRCGTPVVVDYDDAIYLNYAGHRNPLVRRLLGAKIPGVAGRSRHVIAGNRALAEWARAYNPCVSLIPTSVDLRKYAAGPADRPAGRKPVLGWIGTPVTSAFLRALHEPLLRLRRRHDFMLKVIGAPGFTLEGVDMAAVPWSEEREAQELAACDVGVMPIPDTDWGRGKCALKLIQYLAAGVPAVASAVGANCDVVRDGENGFLAATDDEWADKLDLLLSDPARRRRFADAGRETVAAEYSLEVNAPRFVHVFHQVVSPSSPVSGRVSPLRSPQGANAPRSPVRPS
jgi:glycosyltransferase involved in cell wall biosynthesis